MSPMPLIESHHAIEISILTNETDDKLGEEIVALFIAHVNSMRHAQGLSAVCVGSLSSLSLPTTIRVET